MNFPSTNSKKNRGERREKSTLVERICIMFITIHWIHCCLLAKWKQHRSSTKTNSNSRAKQRILSSMRELFVCACWWCLLSGSDWFRVFSFSFLLVRSLARSATASRVSATSDRNYRYLQRVSFRFIKRFSLLNFWQKTRKFFNFLCNFPLSPLRRQQKGARVKLANVEGWKTFGFCVKLIEEFPSVLTDSEHDAKKTLFFSWKIASAKFFW